MFDSVGKNIDDEALKRQAQSVGIVTLLAALISCVGVAGTLYKVKEIVAPVPVDADVVEAEIPQEDALQAPPPPPPPPAGAATPQDEDTPKPTPDEMQDPQTLKPDIPQQAVSDVKPAGEVGGQEGGVEGGVVGGVQGGVVGGVVGGTLGSDGVKVIHNTQVEWKRQDKPDYPNAAKGLGLGDQTCKVVVKFNEEGIPSDVKVDGCPPVFNEETRNTVFGWRVYPLKSGGVKIPFQTVILVKYVMPGSQ